MDAAKFNRKECDADRCKVYIDVSYSVGMPGAGGIGKSAESSSTQSETWVHVKDGMVFSSQVIEFAAGNQGGTTGIARPFPLP